MELVNNTDVVLIDEIAIETDSEPTITSSRQVDLDITFDSKEYSIVGDDMVVVTKYDDAPMWLKNTIANIVDIKTAVAVGDLETVKASLDVMLGELEVAKNTYELSIISSADIDSRINTAITTLNSSLQEADATILEIAQTATTPAEASAIAINTLSASLSANGAIGSAIHNLESAMATLEGTTAESISYLESTMEGEINGNASAMQTIRTYVGIDEVGASTGTGLSGYLEGSDGTIGGADSQLVNDIKVNAEVVESKWAYNSTLMLAGKYYKSGFGLESSIHTSGSGTQMDPYTSEFWIDASKFKFTNSAKTGSKAPFTIDANGPTPQVTFNGVVSFNNVTDTSALTNSIATAQATANSKISTYYSPTAPVASTVGDLWINTTNNSMSRWNGSSWVIVNIDVSSSIATNNDVFAQNLGYANYQAMVNAAASGQTVVNGGYINTELIQAGAITTGMLNANAISGKVISGGVISGTNIYGASIEGSVIKASFIDLTSTATLTNWQQYTPSNYPSQYADNFAHKNDGTLLVDSLGYVRLMGNTNIITTAVDYASGSTYGYWQLPAYAINCYAYDDYKTNNINRCITSTPTVSISVSKKINYLTLIGFTRFNSTDSCYASFSIHENLYVCTATGSQGSSSGTEISSGSITKNGVVIYSFSNVHGSTNIQTTDISGGLPVTITVGCSLSMFGGINYSIVVQTTNTLATSTSVSYSSRYGIPFNLTSGYLTYGATATVDVPAITIT